MPTQVIDDVLSKLPLFEWRGVNYPVSERSVSYRHETIEHGLQYRSGDFPEPVGPHSWLFTYTLPMRNGIYRGNYTRLFEFQILRLAAALRDRTADTLIDPVYGAMRCVPISYADEMDVKRRDGTDIRVEFLHSPEINEDTDEFTGGITSVQGVAAQVGRLDTEIAQQVWEQQEPPEPSTDILSAIAGVPAQFAAQVGRVSAGLHDVSFRLRKIEQAADKAEDPEKWGLRDAARSNRDAIVSLNKRATEAPGKKILRVTTALESTLSDVANSYGMTVADLIRLNPILARSPKVNQGTLLTITK